MITRDVYGIGGAALLRGDPKPFVQEVIYTNDPIEMVQHCLDCKNLSCNHGECPYTRKGEGRRKYRRRKLPPPVSAGVVNQIVKMLMDGWRQVMIAKELGLTAEQVDKSIKWAEKEGLI